ncbi:MAG: DUF1559 domain-containing protein [Planctomycetia bacterium]|nr:DUF1559 domain-containing protein [Planctomycetia bacterium]
MPSSPTSFPGRRQASRARSGFTIVELLVVIAIIGTLVGLLLPAVQAARESSRRGACQSNVKQLALAMLNYESSRKRLPNNFGKESTASPGLPAPQIDGTNRGRSWIMLILPFIEEAATFNQIRFDQSIDDPTNVAVFSRPLRGVLCPSDTSSGVMANRENLGAIGANTSGSWGVTNYKAVAGGNWEFAPTGRISFPTGRWANDSNCFENGNGIICRNKLNDPGNFTRLANITDGTSKTFAIGEAVPEWCTHTTWFHCNHTTASCGLPLNNRLGEVNLVANASDWANNYSFFSRHTGGAMFALCDGSTTFVSQSIDATLYRQLATIDTGEPVSVP